MKSIVVSPPDCKSLTLSRWNLVEPRQFTADSRWSGSLPNRLVPCGLCVCAQVCVSTFVTDSIQNAAQSLVLGHMQCKFE